MNTIMKKIYLFLALFLVATISFPIDAATWSTYRIMLDPGHGGSDPGASGPSAPHEATLALRCGLALRDRIVNECGGTVKMTRTTDTFISLSARQSSKGSYDPYIFCSIHLNAFNASAKGTETYYYHSTGNSSLLANKVQPQLISNFQKVSGFTPTNRGVKTASYTVIMGYSGVPAILTEGLFVDNSTEWSIINDNSKQGFKMWVQGHLYGFYDRLVLLNSSITNPKTTTVADTTKPTISRGTTVQNNSTSFYAYAYASDNVGVSKVEFPTWTVANGQDDLVWHVGTAGSWTVGGQTYNYRFLVNKSAHNNENGPYSVHVYATDAAGNKTNGFVIPNFTFDTTAPSIARTTTVQNDANSFYAYAYATDNVKVTRVSFPTWTNANGQDDLTWHEGTSGSWTVNGQTYNWRYLVKKSEHNNEAGPFTVHVYAYDAAGNSTSAGTSFAFDTTAPVISRFLLSANDDNSFYAYAYVTDNVKVTRVRFPAWTELNGQDDLPSAWAEGTSGSWTVNSQTYNWRCLINKADHNNENGPYNVHVYANDAAGNQSSIQSGDNTKFTIGQGSSTPGTGTTLDDNITAMTEVWNYSATKGNLSSATWFDSTNFTRDVAVNGENLYVLNCKQWGTPVITILNAFTGASKGTLSVEGISDGRAALGAIDMLGGKLIGVNAVTGHELIFYKWDSETAAPTKWATTTPGIAMGDHMSVSGDMSNGAIWLVSTPTNVVYKYTVTNGAVNTTPTIITLSKSIGSQNGCATVAVAADGTLWVDGKDIAPMHFKADGTYIEELASSALVSTQHKGANAVELIKFGSKTYMTAANYVDEKTTNGLSGGAFSLVNLTDGVAAATAPIGTYPSAGLGTTRNTQFLNALTHTLTNNDQQLYVWVAVASQGIACYTFNGAKELETPVLTPEIDATPTTLTMNAAVGETATSVIEVNGSNLAGDINLSLSGTNASMFSISASTIAKATAKGDITVTYTPSAEGDHSATLTIKSTNAKDVTVSLSGYAHNNTSADTGFNDDIAKLDEIWIYSTNKGNTASAPWLNVTFEEDFTRDIAVNGENLYVLNCKQWGTPVITILNAFTGASKGTLSVEGISGGRAALGAIDMLGDKLIGVNAVTGHELVFYKWDSETAAPTKWATTTPGIAMGDQMSVTGNMTNGAIWLINTGTDKSDNEDGTTNAAVPAKVYKYSVTNGVVNTTPTIISLAEPIGSQNGCAGITIAADGTLWVDGKNVSPMHFKADGTFIEELPVDVLGTGNSAGANAIEAISFGSQKYLAATTYVNAAETLSNGAIALVSINAGAETASQVGIYPSNGFGTTRNVQFINALTHSLTDNNTTLNLWGIVAGQGIAYYRYVGNTPSGVENFETTDNVTYPVEWYNLQGIRVNGDNLVPGIYIRRQGNEVKKIMIR